MRLYFAGAENRSVRKTLIQAGVKHVLLSYFYLRKRIDDLDEIFDSFETVVMDSGAFTMFNSKDKIDHVKYLEEYLGILEKYAGRFFWVANYDVDELVGHKLVGEWNDLFVDYENKTGQVVCFVSHDFSYPYKNIYEYFERFNYIGVSGGVRDGKTEHGYFSRVYHLSRKYKKPVHGFGMTNFVLFQNFPFFTVDSTTYLGGVRYGSTYVWNGSFFETWDYFRKFRRKQLKHWCEKWDVDFQGFIDDDPDEVTKFNIHSWLENEKVFNKRTRNKQWWLK